MGHVEIPDTDLSGPVGLRGAPRPRDAASRNRTTAALERQFRAPTARRDGVPRAPFRRGFTLGAALVPLTDMLGLAAPAGLLLRAGDQPRPLAAAAVAGLLWAGLRAARGRYAAGPGARPGGAAGAVGDWLVLLGLLALLHTAAGSPVDPATAVVAVAPGLLVTAVATGCAPGRAPRAGSAGCCWWVRRPVRSGPPSCSPPGRTTTTGSSRPYRWAPARWSWPGCRYPGGWGPARPTTT